MAKGFIHTPHDRFFRASLNDPRVAREFLETHLPEEIQALVDFDTLEMCSGTFVDEELQLHLTDVLFALRCIGEQPGYLYTLLEHLRNPDPLTPFKKLRYSVKIMEQHYKKHKTLPLVYTLVLYNGAARYPYSTDLFDLFGAYKSIAQKTFLQPFDLVDLSQTPDAYLKGKRWSGMMELSLKHISEPDLTPFIGSVVNQMQYLAQHGGAEYLKTMFHYFFAAGNIQDTKALRSIIHHHFSPTLEENIMTIGELFREEGRQEVMQKFKTMGESFREEGRQEVMQKFGTMGESFREEGRQEVMQKFKTMGESFKQEVMQQGVQQGMQQGMQQGRQEAMQEFAVWLLRKNASEEEVRSATGLSSAAIEALRLEPV